MASCRSAEALDRAKTSAAARPSRRAAIAKRTRSRPGPRPLDAVCALLFRPARPLEEAAILADSDPTAGPLLLSEDGRVTTWCTGTDERFAWRWFEQLAAQGVHVVLARLDGCVAVFRKPLPPDPDDPGNGKSQKQRRPCLRCGKSFWSTGPGNRICRLCAIRNAGVMPGFGRPEDD